MKRLKTPTVLQMEAVECGAAALAIVLEYYGRYVPLAELRVQCGVSRDGSKASNIVRAARQYGLEARGFASDLLGLGTLDLPLIVFWNFNHFLVVEKVSPDRYYLNDPAMGPRTVTREEFSEGFTGVALTLKPGPEFQPGGRRPDALQGLRDRLRGSEQALLFALLCGLTLVIPGLGVPVTSQFFVDAVMLDHAASWGWRLAGVLLIAAGLITALTWLQLQALLRLETRLSVAPSARYLWHVLRLPIRFYAQRYAGDISGRLGLNDRLARLISGRLATAGLNLLMILFIGLVMLGYSPTLTAMAALVAALNLGLLVAAGRRRSDLNQRLLCEHGKLMGASIGGLHQIENIKGTGADDQYFARWAGYLARATNARQDFGVYTARLNLTPPFLTSLATASVLGLGGFAVLQGQLSMGMFVAFLALTQSFLGPVTAFVGLGQELQESEGFLRRLDDVFDNPLAEEHQKHRSIAGSGPPRLAGRLELQGITFGYSPLEDPLILDLDLVVEPGQRVALVGATGSGKSTIANLVCGLYPAWKGEIYLDGQPRNQLPPPVVAASLARVDQEISIFRGTIWENLTLWDETLPEEDVLRACHDACIHEEITARPGGYGELLNEGGINLSGGQRQRLEIARALARGPSLLILDEATSSLDPLVEQRIDQNLRRRGCTCLIVAHRLSTIRDCDQILVLEKGRVVERGTHQELLAKGGLYLQLVRE